MFNFFKQKITENKEEMQDKPKRDKVFIGTVIFLAVFIVISLVTGLHSGGFKETDFKFRFNISDDAALLVLLAGYIIFRIRKGRNNDR